jgi:hypothetical protein
MNNSEAVNWLINIAADIGKIEHQDLWHYEQALSEIREMLEDAQTIEPEPKWIPCSVRLPFAEYGESDNVLATCGHRDGEDTSIRWIKTLYFNGGNWCYPTGETYDQKVYAWMPLPECYQEDI